VVFRSVVGMSALQEDAPAEPPSSDAVVARLDVILEELAAIVADGTSVSDARIDRIARLEKLRAVTAAAQAAESVKFAQSQVAEQLVAEVLPDTVGRGIAEQIGLACRISPSVAARRLSTARAWWFELPDTYSQLALGELSERVAEQMVTETRHLDPEMRSRVDKQIVAAKITRLGSRPRRGASARSPTRRIGTAMCSGAAPNGNIAASASGRHRTPWRCSPGISRWNKASPPQTRRHGGCRR
jgi:Domain of unknown function (DUF222)